MKIAFIASECAPFAKTGGLGDVVGALPKALARLGHDVRVFLPLYSSINRQKWGFQFVDSCCVHMGQGEENWVGIHQTSIEGEVPVYGIEFGRFYDRGGIYGDPDEFPDNAFRFALLPKAALQWCKDTDWIPDVAHLHDWSSALGAVFLKTWDRILSPLSDTASVLSIHNIGYPGTFHASAFPYFGVGGELFQPDIFEDNGKINLLKAGIHFADAITTVSPTHAHEMLDPIGGMGLAPYLNNRRGDLTGILNGVDYEDWNPETDKYLPATYSADDLSGKAICKAALQERFNLDFNPKVPIFGIVSRFASQKGFDLLQQALPRALDSMAMQLVVLGTGDRATEQFFHDLTRRYPGRVGSFIGFSVEMSHLVEAGSDFFLMPSIYEPCGLNQSYSMRYGTLPIVRATGGLDDTVHNYDEQTGAGTGFKFWNPDATALYFCMGWAVSTWFDRPHHIAQLRRHAMAQEFLWSDAARQYESVYRHAIKNRRSGAV
ncbi:MAG TPA: glycogen synthase [Abditibacterium sp.]|jgi:starch synthase